MKIVVDTNIVFSALLTPNGKISDLLLNSDSKFDFYSPHSIIEELEKHRAKLCSISGLQPIELEFLNRILFNKIEIIDLGIIGDENWNKAIDLVKPIDEFDAPFVALSLELTASLWTGYKKLKNGLNSIGLDWVLDTNSIKTLREEY